MTAKACDNSVECFLKVDATISALLMKIKENKGDGSNYFLSHLFGK
jgi:hypothetical protein